MWNASPLKREMDQGLFPPKAAGDDVPLSFRMGFDEYYVHLPAYFCVDAAFSQSAHCVKPFPNSFPRTSPQFLFNKVHSKARQVVEQAWGMLVNRFRCWKAPCEIRGKDWNRRVCNTIHACMILHNICINFSDYASNQYVVDEDETLFTQDQWTVCVSDGLTLRDYLSAHVNSVWALRHDDVAVLK